MLAVLSVGLGGFLGASGRYLAGNLINAHASGKFPLATLLINLTGAFLIGFLSHLLHTVCPEKKDLSLFLTTGILGGFTTFSTFSLETVGLFERGETGLASLYIVLSIGCCLLGVVLGKLLAGVLCRVLS